MAGQIETCVNCGGKIGKLETAHIWKENVVCSNCLAKLVPDYNSAPRKRSIAGIILAFIAIVIIVASIVFYFGMRSQSFAPSSFAGAKNANARAISLKAAPMVLKPDIMNAVKNLLLKAHPTISLFPGSTDEDSPLSDEITKGLNNKFEGDGWYCAGLWNVESKGAYSGGVKLTLKPDYVVPEQIGDREVLIYSIDAKMDPSQTPQASAIDAGANASISGKISYFSVTALGDGKIWIDVVVDNAEFD